MIIIKNVEKGSKMKIGQISLNQDTMVMNLRNNEHPAIHGFMDEDQDSGSGI